MPSIAPATAETPSATTAEASRQSESSVPARPRYSRPRASAADASEEFLATPPPPQPPPATRVAAPLSTPEPPWMQESSMASGSSCPEGTTSAQAIAERAQKVEARVEKLEQENSALVSKLQDMDNRLSQVLNTSENSENRLSRGLATAKEEMRSQLEAAERRLVSLVLEAVERRAQSEASSALTQLAGDWAVLAHTKAGRQADGTGGKPVMGEPLGLTADEPEQEYETADSPSSSPGTAKRVQSRSQHADTLQDTLDSELLDSRHRLEAIGSMARHVSASLSGSASPTPRSDSRGSAPPSRNVASRSDTPTPAVAQQPLPAQDLTSETEMARLAELRRFASTVLGSDVPRHADSNGRPCSDSGSGRMPPPDEASNTGTAGFCSPTSAVPPAVAASAAAAAAAQFALSGMGGAAFLGANPGYPGFPGIDAAALASAAAGRSMAWDAHRRPSTTAAAPGAAGLGPPAPSTWSMSRQTWVPAPAPEKHEVVAWPGGPPESASRSSMAQAPPPMPMDGEAHLATPIPPWDSGPARRPSPVSGRHSRVQSSTRAPWPAADSDDEHSDRLVF